MDNPLFKLWDMLLTTTVYAHYILNFQQNEIIHCLNLSNNDISFSMWLTFLFQFVLNFYITSILYYVI